MPINNEAVDTVKVVGANAAALGFSMMDKAMWWLQVIVLVVTLGYTLHKWSLMAKNNNNASKGDSKDSK